MRISVIISHALKILKEFDDLYGTPGENKNGKYSTGHWPLPFRRVPQLVTTRLSELRRYHRRNHIHLFHPGDATPLPFSLSLV